MENGKYLFRPLAESVSRTTYGISGVLGWSRDRRRSSRLQQRYSPSRRSCSRKSATSTSRTFPSCRELATAAARPAAWPKDMALIITRSAPAASCDAAMQRPATRTLGRSLGISARGKEWNNRAYRAAARRRRGRPSVRAGAWSRRRRWCVPCRRGGGR